MSAPIRIDVHRVDGEVTRLDGASGIAVCAPALDQDVKMSDPATVSLRCSDAAELAWNLATLLATIRHVSPEAYHSAHELMRYIDAKNPQFLQYLPNRIGGMQP